MKIRFPLRKYNYVLVLHPLSWYMGGFVNDKCPRPGEDWIRGSDLSDGKICLETFGRIVRDIIAFERFDNVDDRLNYRLSHL